ncbi:DUF3310 domain-containing protein [Jeotgalibaca porci]|uniref:DUF3310 domain-containing protein n=1 Tax=Jeotgalibaca porci TaxID=1868793 RepID=UPI0035A11600
MKLPEWANWLTRDENGSLYAFENKPIKETEIGEWIDIGYRDCTVYETDDTFSHIEWTDEKPTEIKRGIFSVVELNRIISAKAHGYDSVPELSEKPTEVKMTALRDWVNWLARDENNELWCFAIKPYKEGDRWYSGYPTGRCERLDDVSDIYNIIQWTDEEPTAVIRGAGSVSPVLDKHNIAILNDHEHDKLPKLSNPDIINEPNHYKGEQGTETIDFIRAFGNDDIIAGFYWGTAIGYMIHYRNKNGLEDLKEARKNLDWLIEHTEEIE